MSSIELTTVQARRQALRADAGATSATKDAVARGFHMKTIHAVGVVEDVTGQNEELTVLLGIDGETLICPLVRVHGRTMQDTVSEVMSWCKGETVEVTGKLTWPLFAAEIRIEIMSAAKVGG